MKKFAILVVVLASVALSLTAAWGAEEKKVKFLDDETFMEMESLGSPSISPDGKSILFSRAWVDKVNDRSASNLWITDIEAKRVRLLTAGSWRDSSPVWSPDGRKIAFISDRDGTSQLHVMWLDTREVVHQPASP